MCVFYFVFFHTFPPPMLNLSETVQYRPYCVDLRSADRKLPS